MSLDFVRQFGAETSDAAFMKRLQTAVRPSKYLNAGMQDIVENINKATPVLQARSPFVFLPMQPLWGLLHSSSACTGLQSTCFTASITVSYFAGKDSDYV